jgi:hypothetical protein
MVRGNTGPYNIADMHLPFYTVMARGNITQALTTSCQRTTGWRNGVPGEWSTASLCKWDLAKCLDADSSEEEDNYIKLAEAVLSSWCKKNLDGRSY